MIKTICYLLLICTVNVFSQRHKFNIVVNDNNNINVENATVTFYDRNDSILFYELTNEFGKVSVELEIAIATNIKIITTALGFKRRELRFTVPALNNDSIIIVLQDEVETLKELIIESDQKIKINQDTTFLKVSKFINNTEQTLEDVLKKLPGIVVQTDGSIKAHGKVIDKLLVDGEDVFAKNYKLLTKNLDAKVLDEIQILDHFEDNPVLKRLSNSQKVALNIKFKKGLNNIWFGNFSSGLGSLLRYKTSVNVGLLKKKLKIFYFADSNNISEKGLEQVGENQESLEVLNADLFKIEKKTTSIYNIERNQNAEINNSLTLFNQAFSNSLSFNKSLSKKTKVRAVGFFVNDIQTQNFTTLTQLKFENNPINIFENSKFKENNNVISGDVQLNHTYSKKSYFTNLFTYKKRPETIINQIQSNEIPIFQKNNKLNKSFYNHLENTFELQSNNILRTYFYFGSNNISENVILNSNNINFILDNNIQQNIFQNSSNSMLNYGFKTTFIYKNSKFENIISANYDFENETINNNVFDSKKITLNLYSNDSKFIRNSFLFEDKINYFFDPDTNISTTISYLNQTFNSKSYNLYNVDLMFTFKLKKIGNFVLGVNNKSELPLNKHVLPNFFLNNYRTFVKGTEEIHILNSSNYRISYSTYDTKKRFAIDASIAHSDKKLDISTSNSINQNFSFVRYFYVEGAKTSIINLGVTNYFKKAKLASRLETNQNWFKTPLQINSNNITIVENYISNFKLSGTTYFTKFCNFDFGINYNFYKSTFDSGVTLGENKDFFININLPLKEVLLFDLKSQFYYINDNNYSFVNFNVSYQQPNSSFLYSFLINNILNEKFFTTQRIDGFNNFTSSIDLVPNYYYVAVKYRF